MKFQHTIALLAVASISLFAAQHYIEPKQPLPRLSMPHTELPFSLIQDYQHYKIVATHFRTDKKELRYILANPIAFNALQAKKKVLPNGSKIVKIGWSVKAMALFPAALEADAIQRVEYMYKDDKRFNSNGDHWGYARFVKKDGKYSSWQGDEKSCIACHSSTKESDYLFTALQKKF